MAQETIKDLEERLADPESTVTYCKQQFQVVRAELTEALEQKKELVEENERLKKDKGRLIDHKNISEMGNSELAQALKERDDRFESIKEILRHA